MAAARRPRYHLRIVPKVIAKAGALPEDARLELFELIEALRENPQSRELGVLPLKDSQYLNCFSAPFSQGVLVFQIYRDHPAVHLLRLTIFEPESPP